MNILITGGTGFIGKSFIKSISNNHHIFCLVRESSNYTSILNNTKNITIVNCKFEDLNKNEILKNAKLDIIFHFAWEGIRGDNRNNNELQLQNYSNTLNLFEFTRLNGINKVVMLGSQEEFNNISHIDSITVANPITEYGLYKKKVYEYGKAFSKEIGFDFYWLRVFSIYGNGDFNASLIQESLKKLKNGEAITIKYGMKMWDYLFIDDLVELLNILLFNEVKPGLYNVAYGESNTIYEYLKIMKKIVNSNSEIKVLNMNIVNGLEVNIEETIQNLKWVPKYSFEKGISKMLVEERNINSK